MYNYIFVRFFPILNTVFLIVFVCSVLCVVSFYVLPVGVFKAGCLQLLEFEFLQEVLEISWNFFVVAPGKIYN